MTQHFDFMEARDIDGIIRTIPISNLMDFRILGIDIPALLAFRNNYLLLNRPYDITEESINNLFRRFNEI